MKAIKSNLTELVKHKNTSFIDDAEKCYFCGGEMERRSEDNSLDTYRYLEGMPTTTRLWQTCKNCRATFELGRWYSPIDSKYLATKKQVNMIIYLANKYEIMDFAGKSALAELIYGNSESRRRAISKIHADYVIKKLLEHEFGWEEKLKEFIETNILNDYLKSKYKADTRFMMELLNNAVDF